MQFNSLSDFIEMGGYGFYVWLSFSVSALLLIILLISSKAAHQKVINDIARRTKRDDKLRKIRKLRESTSQSQQVT